MKTLNKIIKRAGGLEAVVEKLGNVVSVNGVSKWYRNGIPEKYWDIFIFGCHATIHELHFLNNCAREGFYKPDDLKECLHKCEGKMGYEHLLDLIEQPSQTEKG